MVAPDGDALDKLTEKWRRTKQTGDARVLASAYSDRSIPNLSSVVLYLEHEGSTALLTATRGGTGSSRV